MSAIAGSHVPLVIEDDPSTVRLLSEIVSSLGHSFLLATTLDEARTAIPAGGFCYVLLDMELPPRAGMSPMVGCGETALELLRKAYPQRNPDGRHQLQIIVITGYDNTGEFASRLHEMDANAFLAKPVDKRVPQVLDTIRKALAKAGRAEHAACVASHDDANAPHADAPAVADEAPAPVAAPAAHALPAVNDRFVHGGDDSLNERAVSRRQGPLLGPCRVQHEVRLAQVEQ